MILVFGDYFDDLLDAAENPDEAVRAREHEDLDWWLDQSRRTLESGLL